MRFLDLVENNRRRSHEKQMLRRQLAAKVVSAGIIAVVFKRMRENRYPFS